VARKGRKYPGNSALGNAISELDGRRRRIEKLSSGVRMVRSKKPKYGRNELTDAGTRDRTISRWNRLQAKGIKVKGVTQKNLDTGFGARAVKEALARQRPIKRPRTPGDPRFSSPRTGSTNHADPPMGGGSLPRPAGGGTIAKVMSPGQMTPGQKKVHPGYRNYGQMRSAQVHARNDARKRARKGMTGRGGGYR
jgi:hypothetical protein